MIKRAFGSRNCSASSRSNLFSEADTCPTYILNEGPKFSWANLSISYLEMFLRKYGVLKGMAKYKVSSMLFAPSPTISPVSLHGRRVWVDTRQARLASGTGLAERLRFGFGASGSMAGEVQPQHLCGKA